jgi:hypothetical protein
VKASLGTKFLKLRSPAAFVTGETLISDHHYELHLGGTAKTRHSGNSGWPSVIFGIYVVAQDAAATWMMDIFTGSPLFLSQMSSARGVALRSDLEQFTAQHRSNYRSIVRWLVGPARGAQKRRC